VAERTNVVVTMLLTSKEVEAVIFGKYGFFIDRCVGKGYGIV
jgi:hypothetical protein